MQAYETCIAKKLVVLMAVTTDEKIAAACHVAVEAELARLRHGSAVVGEVGLNRVLETIAAREELCLTMVVSVWFGGLQHNQHLDEKWEYGARFTYPREEFSGTVTAATWRFRLARLRDLTVPGHGHPGVFSFVGDCADCTNGTGRPCLHHDRITAYHISVTPEGATYEIIEV